MRVYIFTIITLLFTFKLLDAKSINCKFEEVYHDGSIQKGSILFHDGSLRYEYIDKNLYTLIIYNTNFFLIRNSDKNIVNKIKEDDLILSISKILKDFPEIENIYYKDDLIIGVEKSLMNDFIKRISIQNSSTNLSIYFYECSFSKLSQKYFQPFNLIKLNR